MRADQLPEEFLLRMRGELGGAYGAFEASMEGPPVRGLRVNTLKIGAGAFRALSPFALTPVAQVSEGFRLEGEADNIGGHALHRAGLFYMQEPSAMLPVTLADIRPGMRVLDLCAAPGGKAGQIAARLQGEGLLIANDAVHARAHVLKYTLERLGVVNALVTCMHAHALCALFEGWFDMVLLDAPCSGEGMFRKEAAAIRDWSPAHVLACARRQEGLIDNAARALRPGGTLVYSTCTYAREENEGLVSAFLKRAPQFTLVRQARCYPHTGPGEGQYMAIMTKRGEDGRAIALFAPPALPKAAMTLYEGFVEGFMKKRPAGVPTLLGDGRLMLLPQGLPRQFERLRLLNAGIHAGDIKKGVFHPAHALCMAYPAAVFRYTRALKREEEAVCFGGGTLAGEGRGYTVFTVAGYPVGLGKVSDGVIKNLIPKGIRWQKPEIRGQNRGSDGPERADSIGNKRGKRV